VAALEVALPTGTCCAPNTWPAPPEAAGAKQQVGQDNCSEKKSEKAARDRVPRMREKVCCASESLSVCVLMLLLLLLLLLWQASVAGSTS